MTEKLEGKDISCLNGARGKRENNDRSCRATILKSSFEPECCGYDGCKFKRVFIKTS
jgi:hypothetical protein